MTGDNTKGVMKTFDIVSAVLLVIGGLNWGLIGFFGFDLVASVFGSMSLFSKILYSIIGLCGLYQMLLVRTISRRWECNWLFETVETPIG